MMVDSYVFIGLGVVLVLVGALVWFAKQITSPKKD